MINYDPWEKSHFRDRSKRVWWNIAKLCQCFSCQSSLEFCEEGCCRGFLNYPTRICKTSNRCVLSLWWVDEMLDVPPKVPKALNNSLGTQTEGMVRWPETWSQTSKESGSIGKTYSSWEVHDLFCVRFFVKEAVPHEFLGFSCYPKYEDPAVKLRLITRCFARLGLLIVIIPNQWRFQHVILSREDRNTTRSTSTYKLQRENCTSRRITSSLT